MPWDKLLAIAVALLALGAAAADERVAPIGIVIMHGKGGSPSGWVAGLASELRSGGYLVANLEMPWSGRRDYDVDVQHADQQVAAALEDLRQQGATKVFVAGHSQGGAFALHYGSLCACDGIIAIAPGSGVFGESGQKRFAPYLEQARQLMANGKGGEQAKFFDYEGSRGSYPIVTTPAAYVDWFRPDGAMNTVKSARTMNPAVPVLWVSPTHDYSGLRETAEMQYRQLPPNPLNRFYRPDTDHFHAPGTSLKEILRWTAEVAAASGPVAPVPPR